MVSPDCRIDKGLVAINLVGGGCGTGLNSGDTGGAGGSGDSELINVPKMGHFFLIYT